MVCHQGVGVERDLVGAGPFAEVREQHVEVVRVVKQNARLLHRPTMWTVAPGAWSRGSLGMATPLAGRRGS